jgi:hypothetical protein
MLRTTNYGQANKLFITLTSQEVADITGGLPWGGFLVALNHANRVAPVLGLYSGNPYDPFGYGPSHFDDRGHFTGFTI